MRRTFRVLVTTTSVLLIFQYIDAGTGSIIIQALIGGALAALVVAKIYWNKIITACKKVLKRESSKSG